MAEDTEMDNETALIAKQDQEQKAKQDQEQFDDYISIAVLLALTAVACLGVYSWPIIIGFVIIIIGFVIYAYWAKSKKKQQAN